MGILPLEFAHGENLTSLGLSGKERYTIRGLGSLRPGQTVDVEAVADDGRRTVFKTHSRVDNDTEVGYMHHGGVLPLVLRQLIAKD
jgi:aconitate hydratase